MQGCSNVKYTDSIEMPSHSLTLDLPALWNRFFGEQVVAACVEAGANHVDISGEPQYLEKMQLKYNEEAKVTHYYSVSQSSQE